MARVVFGGGVSHTPLLTMSPEDWEERSKSDIQNKGLNLSDGRFVDYETLRAEVGDKYLSVATPDVFNKTSASCQAALDRFARDLAATEPDVVIILGDDHQDMFGMDNMPAISVFYGEKVVMRVKEDFDTMPPWSQDIYRGYAQDEAHVFVGHRDLALDIIRGLNEGDVDVAVSSHVPDVSGMGLGHSYGFLINRVMRHDMPIVPIQLNTWYPPNVLSARRCLVIGRVLRAAIEESPLDLRVAIIASGGLSHFVVDEALDRGVLEAFMAPDAKALGAIPREALNLGSSEILNWVVTAGAIEDVPARWSEYYPVYRTPAGSGVGIGIAARW